MSLFSGTKEEIMNKYFQEYYVEADIDIMVKDCSILEFDDIVHIVHTSITSNICKFNPENAKPYHVKLTAFKKAILFVPINYIIEHKLEFKLDSNEAKIYFEPYYKKLFEDYKNTILTDDDKKAKYYELFNNESIEFTINPTNIQTSKLTLCFSHKYKITSPHLNHSIEIFQIKYNDFFSSVSRFHLPCVRAYYNGRNVYMTPSCISAHMTFMNIDYKYFAGTKDPIEIINKYRCRGFGTILNDKEKVRFFEYNNLVEKWKNIYSIKLNDSLAIKKCLGFKAPNDDMFKYSRKVYNDNTNYCNIVSDSALSTERIIENIYGIKNQNLILNIFKSIKFINDYGYIEPLKHYLIDTVYNLVDSIERSTPQ